MEADSMQEENTFQRPAALEIRGLKVDLRQADGSSLRVINGLDLDIGRGEFVSILGPSGCGKTTLIRTVASLVRASAGTIRAETTDAPQALKTGMVPQRPSLLPWLTLEQNVAQPWSIAGVVPPPDLTERIRSVLSAVGLFGFRRSYPSQLSGGMQMRAAIARAFVTSPSLMLLDEAFSGLDEITRDTVADELLALWVTTGATVLFVTHSLADAVYLSDRILVLSRRPARIVHDHQVSLPRPRPLNCRETAEFFEHVKAVRTWVRHE